MVARGLAILLCAAGLVRLLRSYKDIALGRRRRRRARLALHLLQGHHSWHATDFPLILYHKAAMTWQCSKCGVTNQHNSDHCHKCQEHWSRVWQRGRRRQGSQSRPPSKPRHRGPKQPRDKAEKDKEGNQGSDKAWGVFPQKAPWIPSTPQSRLPETKEMESMDADNKLPIPPPPVLPAPPAASSSAPVITEAELKLLSHLRGLQEVNMLPDSLKEQKEILEQKQAEVSASKTLTHGHINKLHKARNQMQNALKRIHNVDAEWAAFMTTVTENVKYHASCYQQHRQELVQQLQTKIQELSTIKEEVSVASLSLVEAIPATETPSMEIDTNEEINKLQAMAEAFSTSVDLVDMSEEELEPVEDDVNSGKEKIKREMAPKPFARMAGSPSKVAVNHLKPKEDKEKEKKAK
eukprot:Skav236238  [mRNA]  locus=scaffold829:205672:206968:+ [translate_table: standard]